ALARIGFATATGPGQDLTLALDLHAGSKYYVRVDEVTGTPFAAGQYELQAADAAPGDPVITLGGHAPVDDAYTNESFLTAARLANVPANGGTASRVFAPLRSNDVDTSTIHSPLPGVDQANVLMATVRAFGNLAPEVTVADAIGLPVSATVTGDG